MAIDYKKAGVDIEKGDALVDWLKEDGKAAPMPHAQCVVDGIGGFASIFRPDLKGLSDPCLVSATDGVGTKLKLAIDWADLTGLGQDLVAMCANDLICTGAQPLFFLDYFATGQLDLNQAQIFLKSVRDACRKSQMFLIGGETAEMPGLYQKGDFDCAGFAVGLVDRPKILGGHRVQAGMVALGVSSSGFHSNGYSLLRKLFQGEQDKRLWGEALLKPTHLYVDLAMSLVKKDQVAAFAHITGGGVENIPRVLPEGLGVKLKAWSFPELFQEAQKRAEISLRQMLLTFNCGVGLVILCQAKEQDAVLSEIAAHGFSGFLIGEVIPSNDPLIYPPEWNDAL